MRITLRQLRVAPNDQVTIGARLPANTTLARLHIFARGVGDEKAFPYVIDAPAKIALNDTAPQMLTPLMMRLTDRRRTKELTFMVDIDGWLSVVQEVDALSEVKAKIRMRRKIAPALPWGERLARYVGSLWQSNRPSRST